MEALAVIAGIVALVCWAAYTLRGSQIYGCLLFLVVTLCFGREFLRLDVGPFFLTLDRALLAGLAVTYVVQRRLKLADPKPAAWPDVAMLLLAIVLALNTAVHNWDLDATGRVSVWRLTSGFLMPMAVYWIVRQSPIDRRAVWTTYVVLTLIGIYLAVTALAETAKEWWLVYPSYIADPKVGIHFGRARGPMVHSQSLGLYLDACLLGLWMTRRCLGRVGALVVVLLTPLFLAAIFFTYARCTWIGAGLCGLVVLGLPMSGRRRAAFVGSALLAVALLAVFQWENLVRIERQGGAGASESSVGSRASFAYVSWEMFLDYPLLGVGYGQFSRAAAPYLADRTTSLYLGDIRNQANHSIFLAMLTETGLIGFGLFVALLTGWAIQSWRTWSNAAAADWVRQQGLVMLGMMGIYLGSAMFFDLTFSPQDQCLTFFLAGLTSGLAARLAGKTKIPMVGAAASRKAEAAHPSRG